MTLHSIRKLPASLCCTLYLLGQPGAIPAQEALFTFAGMAGASGNRDGDSTNALFQVPSGIAVQPDGKVYISDHFGHVIRLVQPDGQVSTIGGRPDEAGHANGPGAEALFFHPTGLAVPASGGLLIADSGNHCIRFIAPDGVVADYAGQPGKGGWRDGEAKQAQFISPSGISIGHEGNLYVADTGNHLIRRISPEGMVTTVAGVPHTWGHRDGSAGESLFNGPLDLVCDDEGSLFVSDAFNYVIRKIVPDGFVTTVAGIPLRAGHRDGDPSRALFSQPAGLALGNDGTLFIADSQNHVIRSFNGEGISTLAGGAGQEGSADGANGMGRMFNPYGLAFRPTGELIVTDAYNHTLRTCFVPFELTFDHGRTQLSWSSIPGLLYRVQFKHQVAGASWQDLDRVTAEGRVVEWSPLELPPEERGFFRVRIEMDDFSKQ